MPTSLCLGALKCLGPGFCNAVSHRIKAYYWLCKYMSGSFQVGLVNQFKRCWGGPFKILAARAHSLPDLRVSLKAARRPRGQIVLQTPLCAPSQICAQWGQGLGFDIAKWIFIWRKHISPFWIQFWEPEYKVFTEPNQSWVVIKCSKSLPGKPARRNFCLLLTLSFPSPGKRRCSKQTAAEILHWWELTHSLNNTRDRERHVM